MSTNFLKKPTKCLSKPTKVIRWRMENAFRSQEPKEKFARRFFWFRILISFSFSLSLRATSRTKSSRGLQLTIT